jgi:hypothetical protein
MLNVPEIIIFVLKHQSITPYFVPRQALLTGKKELQNPNKFKLNHLDAVSNKKEYSAAEAPLRVICNFKTSYKMGQSPKNRRIQLVLPA